jgi:dTDP-4-dehydrorhamnose 3,5-epimerase
MIFTESKIKGVFIVEIKKLEDERGFFGRIWCKSEMEAHGLKAEVLQVNTSFSRYKGTLRGMHFQKSPYAETKLIRCTKGAIYDVAIDLRPQSPTFKNWFGIELSEENYKMLYVPEGFAHGFLTLQDNSEVSYLVSQFYNPSFEGGVRWDDPAFNISWPVEVKVISERDKNLQFFSDI